MSAFLIGVVFVAAIIGGFFLMRRVDLWIRKIKKDRLDVIALKERDDQ
ncbi:MAG: hypothetical protein IJ744_09830 [Lachnospiraceae bacterium]|nr:hypothetical protein [Lachnospiraceae bacterium]